MYLNINIPDVTVLDPFSLFCTYKICNYVYNNISLYDDTNHLNGLLIKNRVIDYFKRKLKFPINCNKRINIYQCEFRLLRFMNYESKKYADSIKIKVLKTLYPKPVLYTGKIISKM